MDQRKSIQELLKQEERTAPRQKLLKRLWKLDQMEKQRQANNSAGATREGRGLGRAGKPLERPQSKPGAAAG